MESFTAKIALLLSAFFLTLTSSTLHAQMGKCKGKYLGSAYSDNSAGRINFNTYWNQCTAENGSKWGSVEGTQGSFNWSSSDNAYNWAKTNNGLFKYHNFVWGSQYPSWVSGASVATIQAEIENYIKACSTHYTPMGGIKLIDVVNEPVHTAITGNYKAALTAGYKAEPANQNDLNNQYGWIIWPYQLARKYFPNAKLLLNEYSVENDQNGALVTYAAMANAVKNAPNITDGTKNLIDGVGFQSHAFSLQNPDMSAATFKAALDKMYSLTSLPIHITELDLDGPADEQLKQYQAIFATAWEHPHVAGITIWGYVDGQTWRTGRTDNGLVTSSGTEHSAMTWIKSYMASQPDISPCPLPGTVGPGWSGGNNPPTVSITSPADNATFSIGANITITATASDTDGKVAKVEFYNGSTKLGQDTTSPYSYTWTAVPEGAYTITAKATDNGSSSTISDAISIIVGNPIINLVTNGEFDNGTTDWTLQLNNSTTGTMTAVTNGNLSGTNSLRLCPTSAGDADWNVQVSQTVGIVNGKNYKITYLAKADAARTITVAVQEAASPYSTYFGEQASLTTTSQAFTHTFTADTTDPTALIKFFVGNNTTCLNIDNIVMQQVSVVTDIETNDFVGAAQQVSLYPNPFHSDLTLEVKGTFSYLLMDQLGQVLETGKGENKALLASSLNKGVYFVSIETAFGKKTLKVVKE